jgi:hypothetical protein
MLMALVLPQSNEALRRVPVGWLFIREMNSLVS